jgi:A/G-specific adenine glycosylase
MNEDGTPIIINVLDNDLGGSGNINVATVDYGTMIKKEFGNLTQKSSTYKKQTPFIGSKRQIRGSLIKLLLEHRELSANVIEKISGYEQPILYEVLNQLANENIVRETSDKCYIIAE